MRQIKIPYKEIQSQTISSNFNKGKKRIGNPNYYKTVKNGKTVYLLKNPEKPKQEIKNRLNVDQTNYSVKYEGRIYGVDGFIKNFRNQIKYLILKNPQNKELGKIIHIPGSNIFRLKGKELELKSPVPFIVEGIELIKKETEPAETIGEQYQRWKKEFEEQRNREIENELNSQLYD